MTPLRASSQGTRLPWLIAGLALTFVQIFATVFVPYGGPIAGLVVAIAPFVGTLTLALLARRLDRASSGQVRAVLWGAALAYIGPSLYFFILDPIGIS